MKINVSIMLEIEAPDTTGFSGDVERLLREVSKKLLDGNTSNPDLVKLYEKGEKIIGEVSDPNTRYSDNAAIYLAYPADNDSSDVRLLVLKNKPLFNVGDKVYVDRSEAAKGGYVFKPAQYNGEVIAVSGACSVQANEDDRLHLSGPHFYRYVIREWGGAEHRDVPESEITLREDDGA